MTIIEKISISNRAKYWLGTIPLEYRYTAGIAGDFFLKKLKDEGKIFGGKCAKCGKIYLPPKIYCQECFSGDMEFIEIIGDGRIHSFTTCYEDFKGRPLKKRIILGMIKYKGVEGGLLHKIQVPNTRLLSIGTDVRPVFQSKKNRKGSITDIKFFKIL